MGIGGFDPFGSSKDEPIAGGGLGYSSYDIASNPLAPLFGKPSSAMKNLQGEALMNATFMPRALWDTTEKVRGGITRQLEDFVSGNTDVTSLPMYAPGKAAIEDAYNSARQQVMANTPAGGLLTSELNNLSMDRAKNMTNVIGDIQDKMMRLAYGAGYGTPGTAISGAGNAANTASNAINAQQANAAMQSQGFGELIGMIASK